MCSSDLENAVSPIIRSAENLKTSVGQVGGIYRNLQGIGPTALNPLATRTPTTLLGKVGKSLNPLNPVNAPGLVASLALDNRPIPEGRFKRDLETAFYTPGGPLAKVAATVLLSAPDAGVADEAALIRQSLAKGGTQVGAKNTQGQYWAGKDWGYQSPESFNKLYGTRLASGGVNSPPSAPDLNTGLFRGPQAGQLTASLPPNLGAGSVSNGAGVPAQREDVLNRSLSQEVLNAAQQYAAPTNVPLSAFYEGQQQLGRSMMQQGNLVSELQRLGAAPGMAPENFKAWAQANPDLAYRELLRLKQNQ